MNNMKPYFLENYKLIENIQPSKFYVNKKIRYDHKIKKYDFIVYDAGYSIYSKINIKNPNESKIQNVKGSTIWNSFLYFK